MSKPLTHEQKTIASFIAAGAKRCETFSPYCQTHFADKHGELSEHRPDYIYTYPDGSVLFIESKAGGSKKLNTKQSKKACVNKLRSQYRFRFAREPGNMSHSALSESLWSAGFYNDCLDHAWNHALAKILITQKALGPEKFILVFTEFPTDECINFYEKKGLAFIMLSDLHKFLH
jgi:hypothetical protein